MAKLASRFGITAVGAAFCIGLAAPLAHAAVTEDGTKYCGGSTPFSYVQYKTKGNRAVRAPGGGTVNYNGTSSWYVGERQGIEGGGFWFVRGDIDLDQAYTKGLCRNYG